MKKTLLFFNLLLFICFSALAQETKIARTLIDAETSAGGIAGDIHDTILIAATFSLFNRYVDGLASLTPTDPKAYEEMGKRMSSMGYILPKPY